MLVIRETTALSEFSEAALLTPQSVRSFCLYLQGELLSSVLFLFLRHVSLALDSSRRSADSAAHRETLHQRALHVNAITSKMNPPREQRNNFPQVGVACICNIAARMYCKQLSFCHCVWHTLSFIDRKSNARRIHFE